MKVIEITSYSTLPTVRECGSLADRLLNTLTTLHGLNFTKQPREKRHAAQLLSEALNTLSQLQSIRNQYVSAGMEDSLNVKATYVGYQLLSSSNERKAIHSQLRQALDNLDKAAAATEKAHVAGIISEVELNLILEELNIRRKHVLDFAALKITRSG